MSYDRKYAEEVLGADCSHCPLAGSSKFVPSDGPDRADVAFVGEAPGIQEAREGKPFIGPSGRLLQKVLEAYGIERKEVLLTNACLCRPLDGKPPAKSAIGACRPRLLNELAERNTTTVVVLGNSAALSTLGVDGVTKLRVGPGRKSPYEELAGARVISTVHPAACLRQSDMFPSLVADVGKVVAGHVAWNPPKYIVYDDPMDAIAVLGELQSRAGDLVIDIEVDIEKDSSFDHPDRYGQLCIGLGYESGRVVVIGENALRDGRVLDALADCLAASRLIAQNGKFDLAGLFPTLGPFELVGDNMLASYALDERPGIHGLKQQAIEELGAPQYDEDIKKYVDGPTEPKLEQYSGYGRIPRPILYKYNAIDVASTWDLWEIKKRKMARSKQPSWWPENAVYPFKSLRELHDFLVAASNQLMFLELNGIAIDRDYNLQLWDGYQETLGALETKIGEILVRGGYNPINPRSPKQVKEALAHFRVNAASTNEETLRTLLDQLYGRHGLDAGEMPLTQFTEQLLLHRREAKMFGTYVKGIRKRMYKGRVYSTFSLHGTTTGRLASRNPNVQNIVREARIKKQFIPAKEGNVFVNADYKQAELRIESWLAQDTYFRDILNDPTRDLFNELTPILYPGKTKDMVIPLDDFNQLMTGERPNYIDAETWKTIRVRVKAFVYGLSYGRTEYSIAMEYKIPPAEASVVTKRFFSAIPEIVAWQQNVKNEVKIGHDLINPFGRHRRFHLITEENWKSVQNEALAFLPQSTSSDVCLRALVAVRPQLRGTGAFVRNIVHDNLLVDCPPDIADDVAALLDREMVASGQELVGDYINFETDITIGKHWGEV